MLLFLNQLTSASGTPATWQLIVTFTPCTVLMVPPTSTVTAGFSVLITVTRDVFTSGFPANVTAMETESYPKAFVALQV